MDKETIRKVALEKYDNSEFRVPNAYCFIEGAEWLCSQPIEDKMSDSDRNVIADWLNNLAYFIPDKGVVEAMKIGAKKLFGPELFKEEVK